MSDTTPLFTTAPEAKDDLPAWMSEVREQAWKRQSSLAAPTPREQDWRFATGKKRDLSTFTVAPERNEVEGSALADRIRWVEGSIRLAFVNGNCVTLPDLPKDALDAGLICAPVGAGAENDALKALLTKTPRALGGEKFAELHQSHLGAGGGLVLDVPKGLELKAPIEVVHWISGEGSAIFPRTVIHAGEGSSVTVVERLVADGEEQEGFSCGAVQIVAPQNARVRHILAETLSRRGKAVHFSELEAGRDSDVRSSLLALGGDWFRTESVANLVGEGANCEMLSVALSSRDQEFDQRTLQHHKAPRATSDLLFKNALYDTSKTIFSGLIEVDEGAHHTDAYQTCRNLLLSDAAEANAMPGLEINADQVKCSHGATSGRIPESEIFYLRTRGIRPEAARKLILLGFTMEVLERIGDAAVVERLATAVEEKFVRVGEEE